MDSTANGEPRDILNISSSPRKEERSNDEIDELRKQYYEDTMIIHDQLESICQKNTKLSADLRKVSSERDELHDRLEFNIHLLEELKRSSEKEKKDLQTQIREEKEKFKQKIESKNDEYTKQISEYQNQIDQNNKIISNQKNECKELQNSINNILLKAQEHFQFPFNNANSLISFLQKAKKKEAPEPTSPTPQETDKYKTGFKKLKQKFLNLKQKYNDLKQTKQENEKEITELKAKNLEYLDHLSHLQESTEKTQFQNQQEYQKQLSAIERMYETEKEHVKDLQDKLEQANDQILNEKNNKQNNDEINLYKQKLNELKLTLNTLQANNNSLNEELLNKHNKYKTRIKEKNQENKKLKNDNLQLRNENEILKLEIEKENEKEKNYLSQIKSSKITNDQYNLTISEDQHKISKYQKSIELLESSFNKQAEELSKTMKERSFLIEAIQKLGNSLKCFEDICFQQKSVLKKQQKEIETQRKTISQMEYEKVITPNPIASALCSEFPKELRNLIASISNEEKEINPKQIMEIIGKYYNQQINDIKKLNRMNLDEKEKILQKIESLLNTLSTILQDITITKEAFLNDPTFEANLINKISNLIESKIKLTTNNQKLNNDIKTIEDKFKVNNFPDLISMIENKLNEIETLKKNNEKLQIKAKKIKKSNSNSLLENEQQNILVQDYQERLNRIEKENFELKKKSQQLQQQNSQMQTKYISQISEIEEDNSNLRKQIELLQNDYNKQMQLKGKQIDECNQQQNKLEIELQKWKYTSECLSKIKSDNAKKIKSLEEQINKYKKLNEKQIKDENIMKEEKYQQIVDKFKEQNNELRDLLQNTTNSLNESNLKNKEIIEINANLSKENQKLEAKMNLLKEETKREIQITSSKMRAIQLSTTAKFQMELDEMKTNFANEKRKIYSFFAKNFSYMFDPNNKLNEENYKICVTKGAQELQRLLKQEQAIRHMLGISQIDSIEKEISRILMEQLEI